MPCLKAKPSFYSPTSTRPKYSTNGCHPTLSFRGLLNNSERARNFSFWRYLIVFAYDRFGILKHHSMGELRSVGEFHHFALDRPSLMVTIPPVDRVYGRPDRAIGISKTMIKKFKLNFLTVILSAILAYAFSTHEASAKVICDVNNALSSRVALPVHQWCDDSVQPRGVVIAIHGLTLHGTLFDSYARRLAANGFLVVAPDLRGYGDWFKSNKNSAISYSDSEHDLSELVSALRRQYTKLPLFCSGESLGGAMTIRLAAANPEWFDGLILSAPALRLSHHVPVQTLLSSLCVLVEPKHKINLSPYLQRDERGGTGDACSDALVRSRLSLSELRSSFHFIDATDRFVSEIPSTMPVLVMQGTEDHVLNMGGLKLLEKRLVSTDRTVQIFPHRGHILLERKDIADETLQTVSTWLDKHCDESQARLASAGYNDMHIASAIAQPISGR
jgi:alpha-beta hydrolase superfamily lysophospholipase